MGKSVSESCNNQKEKSEFQQSNLENQMKTSHGSCSIEFRTYSMRDRRPSMFESNAPISM